MATILAVLLIPAFLGQVFCLQCNTCHGEYDCVGEKVTCEAPSASCTTSVRKAYVSFLEFQSVKKGCARQLYPPESISINSHLLSLSYQAHFCDKDGCNNESYFVSHPPPANHMRCHTCASQGVWCPETSRTQITCVGDQDQCVDLDITGKLGQYSNLKLKGCTNLRRCEETLSFYSGSRTIHTSCCNTPLCNAFNPDLHVLSQVPNGLECYSCVDDDGSMSGCSSKAMSKVRCMGLHTMCLEGVGNSRRGGKDLGPVTFKGCASPAMCQSPLLSLVQELDNSEVLCCQGNLCNGRIVGGVVREARVPADSADVVGVPACVTATSGQPSTDSRPECTEEKEDKTSIMPAPAGVAPPSGSHVNTETTDALHGKEAAENLVNEGAAATASPHHEVHSGERVIDENLSGGPSGGNAVSPTGGTGSEHHAPGGSSATTNLDKSDSGANAAAAGNHGNIVVLVPVVVSKRNNTIITSTSSSSSETSTTNKVLEASNNKVLEASNNKALEASNNKVLEASNKPLEASNNKVLEASNNKALEASNNKVLEASNNTPLEAPNNKALEASNNKVLEASNNKVWEASSSSNVFEEEECEEDDKEVNTGGHLFAGGERNREASPSTPGGIAVPARGSSNADVIGRNPDSHGADGHNAGGESFAVEGNTASHNPGPGHSAAGNHATTGGESFVADPNASQPGHGTHEISADAAPLVPPKADGSFIAEGDTSRPSGAGAIPGAVTATARPKNKVPCKRPRSQNQPGEKLVASSGAEKQVRDEGAMRDATSSLFSETKNPGKVNPGSGAFGLSGSLLHLFALSLVLVALLH